MLMLSLCDLILSDVFSESIAFGGIELLDLFCLCRQLHSLILTKHWPDFGRILLFYSATYKVTAIQVVLRHICA